MPGISAGLGGQVNNNIQTDGLIFYVDSAYKKSYLGSGTTWNDLGGSNNGTLTMLYSADDSAGGDPYYRTYIRDNFAVGWHYVSLNWNSNKYDIYVNADSKTTYASTDVNSINYPLSGTAAGHVPLMTMDEFKLGYGSYHTGAHPEFDGRIQVVQIYDKSLTASEIKQNYDASKERFGL